MTLTRRLVKGSEITAAEHDGNIDDLSDGANIRDRLDTALGGSDWRQINTGPQGPAGPAGADGATGPQGPAGADGAVGPQGPQGPAGAVGPQGPAGADGSDGASFSVDATGLLSERSTYDAEAEGFAFLATDTGDLYIREGVSGWSDPIPFQGPVGPAGADGADGAVGPTGPQGPAGNDGAVGPQGPAGPEGPAGPQGPAGSDGAAGADGTDGRTVLNGTSAPGAGLGDDGDFYIDTAADAIYGPKAGGSWGSATSLVGPTGADGSDGADGAVGPAGPQGPQGTAGADGADGNLWTDPVNAPLIPDANNTRDVGSDAARFAQGHFETLNVGGNAVSAIADPAGDALPFFDLSSGGMAYLATLTGLTITGTTLSVDTIDTAGIADDAVTLPKISATGTASATTFLRGDGSWATPAGGAADAEVVVVCLFDGSEDVTTGDAAGDQLFRVPSKLNGWNLTEVAAYVETAGVTGTTTVQVHNVTDTVDMLSTAMTIDTGETDTSTAATPAVIDTANDDVATGDKIRFDVDTVSTGTAPQGLWVELTFEAP